MKKSETGLKDEGRTAKLRQVTRRLKNGSSMVRRMTPVSRVAHVKRQHRGQRP